MCTVACDDRVMVLLCQPENLLLASEGGQLKLSDAGLGCFLGDQLTAATCSKAPGYLGESTTLNTYYTSPSLYLHYTAPEVLMGAGEANLGICGQ